METLLRKKRNTSSKNNLQENFSSEINLDEVTSYLKVITNTETSQKNLTLKEEWMEFIDVTMSMMHSKISL